MSYLGWPSAPPLEFCRVWRACLAHRIDSEGLHPTEEKVRAIMDADTPRDVKALRSFLGLIMFCSKFLENHSTVLAPLNKLLCKDVTWNWTENHDTAFLATKGMLVKSPTLVHYDDILPLYMSCDGSAYGCGGVLFHRIDNNYVVLCLMSSPYVVSLCDFAYYVFG